MEVYILDSLLRRIEVVDKFESLIWTERFSDIGDFELDILSTRQTRSQFAPDTKLATNNSYSVMVVETLTDSIDSEGRKILKVTGHSIEKILKDRLAKQSLANLTVEPVWDISDYPSVIIETMFNAVCVLGVLDSKDIIPFINMGAPMFPADNIPEPDMTAVHQEPDSLYNAFRKICEAYEVGFRIARNFDTSELYFDAYTGCDRTTRQVIKPPVVFSSELDNLQDTTKLTSVENAKNVAYSFSSEGFEIVYAPGVDPDVEGFERRIVFVNPGESPDPDKIDSWLQEAGTNALAEFKAVSIFDGELNSFDSYKYGVDYFLGDLVELRSNDGVVEYKRVTEQIFVSDNEGERSYPTLSIDMYIGLTTWFSESTKVWTDYDTETWDGMTTGDDEGTGEGYPK